MKNNNSQLSGSLLFAFAVLFLLMPGCSQQTVEDLHQYESDRGKRLAAQNAMVSSAHPLASEAGLEMMLKGGNAVDAAVATAFALGVVEPNMSGLGGGGGMLIWKQDSGEASYVDFYPAKLASTYRDLPYEENDDEFDLLSTGIPGTVAGLLEALEKHGTLSRAEVMAPAIRYAEEGFPVYLTLAQFIRQNETKLIRYDGTANTFWPDGEPLKPGELLVQPELAATLKKISEDGSAAFYEGEIADNMVQVLNEAGNPVSIEDFREYEPQWDKLPLCGTYKDHVVLSAPPPQTGFYILHALNLLEHYNLKEIGTPTVSAGAFDILSSALRLSIADRVEFVSDPKWSPVPAAGLISKEYAEQRLAYVGTGQPADSISTGDPGSVASHDFSGECSYYAPSNLALSDVLSVSSSTFDEFFAEEGNPVPAGTERFDEAEDSGETTHLSVVDPDGNAVSLSTTLSPVFGSGAWVDGFILNTSGYNFANMEEGDWNGAHPYRIRASTVSPTIILKEGEVRLVIGAPGGARIPTAVLQNILYIIEYDLDPLDAVRMPRIFPDSRNLEVQLERGFEGDVVQTVREMGYDLQTLSQGYARIYLVAREGDTLIGVADPRHDGEVRGF